jgi:predicted GNAT family acetyltransferase
VEAGPFEAPPGLTADPHVANQMVAERLAPLGASLPIIELTEDDAPRMLALATLTKPGPFFAKTYRLGGFVGLKEDGRLLAMAGERLKVEGFTEVSGVCTHPDARGRGYAKALMLEVAHRIAARGETPFLHVYPWNTGAIELYERLGFRFRAAMNFVVLSQT